MINARTAILLSAFLPRLKAANRAQHGGQKKEGPRHPGSGPVLVARTVNLYAISGILFIDRSAGMCFFNHTLALHRPTNGAAAIIPNEMPNAICIQLLLSPRGLD
jgi:hypothetical protein